MNKLNSLGCAENYDVYHHTFIYPTSRLVSWLACIKWRQSWRYSYCFIHDAQCIDDDVQVASRDLCHWPQNVVVIMLLITSMSTTINYCVMCAEREAKPDSFSLNALLITHMRLVGHKSLPSFSYRWSAMESFFFEDDDESRWMNREQLKMAWHGRMHARKLRNINPELEEFSAIKSIKNCAACNFGQWWWPAGFCARKEKLQQSKSAGEKYKGISHC